MRRKFLPLVLIFAILVSTFSVQLSLAQSGEPSDLKATGLTPDSVVALPSKSAEPTAMKTQYAGSEKLVSVIVKLEDAPLAARAGTAKLDVKSAESQAYLDYLAARQEGFISAAKASLSEVRVTHRYDVVLGGVSMLVPESQVGTLSRLPGVVAVYPDEVLQIDTDSSPEFIGADTLWNQVGGQASAGEGIVVGVLDTGIWPEHPSFADPDIAGNPYPAPPGGPYDCNFGNTAWNPDDDPFPCNNKLIGAYEFMDTYKLVRGLDPAEFDSARDSDGHGSHTTSTAAGNAGVEASIMGAFFGEISGIAPRAHVIMYRVCGGPTGSCYASDSAAAVQQAILDGVDVLNFSIGGGSDPYSDAVSQAFFDAFEAGVFVACSAGNDGPDADTVGHREPWVTTVANTTQVRTFEGTIHVDADGGASLDLTGVSITGGTTGALVLGTDYGDPLCGSADGVNPFPPGTFTSDQIVVCQRGIVARVEKSANVFNAGGGGMILYNPGVNTLNSDNHFVPTVHIDHIAGAELLTFMDANTGEVATLTGGVKVDAQGDVMAASSSRGGPGQSLGISKPDISAPGINILAAHTPMPAFPFEGGAGVPGQLFQAIGGTSMSSPHIAGAGALLMDLHPDWTPAQIKSALMTTAWIEDVVKEDGSTPVDPFDVGSGRVDLNKAGNPGLTFPATGQDYIDHQYDLWNTNYPSLYVPVMPGRITVRRTVHNESHWGSGWWLWVDSPDDVDVLVMPWIYVPGNGDKTFSITVDARDVPLGEVRHATLYLKRGCKELRFPITIVRDQPAVTLDKTCDPATFAKRETTDCTLTLSNTSYDAATVSLIDFMPWQLRLVNGSVVGADQHGPFWLDYEGALYGAEPPTVSVGAGSAPYGYLPLSAIGAPPNVTLSDEYCVNFLADFVYAGETYSTIGMVSNGYAVAGGCASGDDISYINQILPDPSPPNNVFAAFWTDLNPDAGGNYYAYNIGDGVNNWIVLEWEDAPNYGDGEPNSFQIWVGTDGFEDISFTYGPTLSDGDGGWLTVGAEDAAGLSGENYYADGVGTLPVYPDNVVVTSVPGAPGETHTITYTAEGRRVGEWKNCAEMTGDIFFGTNIACFSGEVTRP
jgi:subtilisin family serine protease